MKRAIVLDKMNRMYMDYEMYLNMRQMDSSSAGMVASYAAVGGGKTNRITSLTEQEALRAANFDAKIAARLQWIDCAWSVFMRFMAHSGAREKNIAYVLFHRALLGWTFSRIASGKLPSGSEVTRQRIYQLYEKAVDAVMAEAEKRGLLR